MIDVYTLPRGRYLIRLPRGRTLPLLKDPDPEDTIKAVKDMLHLGSPVTLEVTAPLKQYRLIAAYPVTIEKPHVTAGFVNVDALLGAEVKVL